jgi:hypothetical protein
MPKKQSAKRGRPVPKTVLRLPDLDQAKSPKAGIDRLAPHDLRRTCARLCHSAGGESEQIQFGIGIEPGS